MKVNILYFSSIKDTLKKSSEVFEFDKNIAVEDIIKYLKDKYPEISDKLDNVMVAVNEEYKDKSYKVNDGDVVALIPPVSGG